MGGMKKMEVAQEFQEVGVVVHQSEHGLGLSFLQPLTGLENHADDSDAGLL